MADFSKAWSRSSVHEGGYAHLAGDSGGETYRGISRTFHPNWPGWKIIDRVKPLPYNFTDKNLDKLAGEYYQNSHWPTIAGDSIINQAVAEIFFDHSFSGIPRNNRMIRHMLRTRFKINTVETGNITTELASSINKLPPQKVVDTFLRYRSAMFNYSAGRLRKTDPEGDLISLFAIYNSKTDAQRAAYGSKWINGWINRVQKFATNTVTSTAEATLNNSGKIITTIAVFGLAAASIIYYKNGQKRAA